MNPRHRYILLCFYYVATGTYCGGSEFKYLGSVPKNECSIVLEICPIPNTNLPDSVNKCKTDIKTYLLMQPCHFNFLICRFELLCQTVIKQELLTSQVSLHPPSATEQTYHLQKPIDMKLDMCDAKFKSISFQISKLFNIVLKS